MTAAQSALAAILVVALVLQAVLPGARVLVVASAAAASCLAAALLGVATTSSLLADVPWDVLVILVALGLLSRLVAESRLFGVLAVAATTASRGEPRRVAILFAIAMYAVSGLVNNITALVLVLPVLLVVLKLMGTRRRHLSWTLGTLLVACNLGGAATPIGDFPAILLLGRGSMGFADYLARAAPATMVGLVLVLLVAHGLVRPERELPRAEVSRRLTVAVVRALHRRVRVDPRLLVPASLALAGMLIAWIAVPRASGVGPELICWLGAAAALLSRARAGERLVRTAVDVEAVLFLLSLFVMVVAVRKTGLFTEVARALSASPLPPEGQLVLFLVAAGVLTGIFSAGPSMAALLEVAEALASRLPPAAVYVGLALSVCAGSSLFLTAATSGPLAQALTERAGLRDPDGRPLRFGFFEFLPVGLCSFACIQVVAVGYAFFELWRASG